MAEYIEREAMKRALRNAHLHLDETGIVIEIDDIPSADVQPVKHGKWVFYKPPDDWIKMHLSPKSFYVCDICGHIEDGKQNYCSHCGAKMDGEDNG